MTALEKRLAEIEARVGAATPGPWMRLNTYAGPCVYTFNEMPNYKGCIDQRDQRRLIAVVHSLAAVDGELDLGQDANFIANARADLALLAEIVGIREEALRCGCYCTDDTIGKITCDLCEARSRVEKLLGEK